MGRWVPGDWLHCCCGTCHRRLGRELVLGPAALAEVLHGHNLDDEARPAGKVLRALALARLGVVLLPGEAGRLPALEDGVDEVRAEARVDVPGALLEGALLGGDVLARER
ncbi:hypothetical protein HYQ46_010577 [Verticillium longisporum]|nr:hypothetical protein HYQ46_010577 [Verticillium longisporum]